MSLVTRCPRCKTLFRVMPLQLQTHGGRVRCGRCMHVFDGFQSLAVEQPGAVSEVRFEPEPASAAAPDVAAATPAPTTPPDAAAGIAAGKSTTPAAPDAPPAKPAPDPLATPATDPTAPSAKPGTDAVAPLPIPEPDPLAPPSKPLGERLREFADARRQKYLRKPSPAARRIAACVLLGVLLAGQMAYAFRSQLAARYPVMKTALNAVCELAGCTVPLPPRPDLVKIEASDVHVIDTARPALIQLTATLRSYASYDLAYPALDLVLTNANEHALARRIFLPEEYLDQTRDPKAGIPPHAEITVALDLDTRDLNAAGFRLELLAAPGP